MKRVIIKLPFFCSYLLLVFLTSCFVYSDGWNLEQQHTVRVSEDVWREAAHEHQKKVRKLLQPGLVPFEHPLNAANRKNRQKPEPEEWTALDPKHPVYNFLIEYYGLKGTNILFEVETDHLFI